MKRIIIALTLSLMAVLLTGIPVLASVAAPDGLYLLGTYAFRNNMETGDMTFVFYYNAYYATTYPTEISADTLIIQLMNGSSILGAVAPYPYYSNGYQRGVAILYFTAAEVAAKGLTWGAAYTPMILPNPMVSWTTTPGTSYSSIEWDTAANMSESQRNLGNKIISLALILKTYWGVNLAEAVDGINYRLTSSSATGSGVDYFTDVCGTLARMAPNIFPTTVEQPIYKTTTPTISYAPDELPVDPTPAATVFGMSKGTLTSMVAMIGILMFSFYLVSQRPELTRFILLIDGSLVIFFTRIGAVVPIWATVVATAALFIIAYVVFYEKSNV